MPKQAARFYRRRIGEKPTTEQLEHLVDIYLSGQMYEQALNVALEVVGREKTAEALESLGDIYYALHRYDESGTAYEQAAGLSSEPSLDFLMKAGYSAMKSKQYTRAAAHFEQVVGAGSGDEEQVQLAMQNLAWIRRLQAWQID